MKKSVLVPGLVLYCALALGVAGCGDQATGGAGESTTTAVAPQNATEAEEYAVYSALIQAMYIDGGTSMGVGRPQMIVVQDQTELGPAQTMSETLNGMSHAWPDLSDEILADFKAKNGQPVALKPLFSLDVDYVFFSDQEMEAIFVDSSGWDAFYEKYPHSRGILTLSRVGFDQGLDTAVVCVGNQMHWVAGEGYFVLLEKVAGRWAVRGNQRTWIS